MIKSHTNNFWNIRCFIAAVLLISNLTLPAQTAIAREYQVKAVFIFNFTQFVDWPSTSFASEDAPLVIAVSGENPFGSFLREMISGEKVKGHPVLIQYYDSTEEIQTCHILFVGFSDPKKSKQLISALKDRSILTISDQPGFLIQGGMIKLFTKNNNIRFEINPEVAKAAGLVLSSKLLRLAKIFDPSKNR